jgi:hypothetical protein
MVGLEEAVAFDDLLEHLVDLDMQELPATKTV